MAVHRRNVCQCLHSQMKFLAVLTLALAALQHSTATHSSERMVPRNRYIACDPVFSDIEWPILGDR